MNQNQTPPVTDTFDITGDLPASGVTLIEASAGTGKTWTVAALATRYVAERGMPLDQLLVVTFSRAASQELRERVRARLEETLTLLESGDPSDDPLVAHLRDCDTNELALRVRRLRAAVADFDTATIATIHQFCHYVLRGLGVAGDSDPGATLAEDLADLQEDVIDDLFLATHLADPSGTPAHDVVRKDSRHALANPGAVLHPHNAAGALGPRLALVRRVLEEFRRRKRRASVLSYDDLLEQLATALEDEHGPARQRMRDRWSVVLVDEFQDTDPVQWQVFSRAFAHPDISLLLIGDPKQAIYAFRGGDIHTYLQAAATADRRTSLPTNFRSDEPLVRSLQTLMNGVALSEGIVVHPVTAHHQGHRLAGAPDNTPIRLRAWPMHDGDRQPGIGDVRAQVYPDVADDIQRLLASGATLDGRPVQPHDIAVLCHFTKDLAGIRKELQHRGIPSVLGSNESVLRTPAAEAWLELLMALEQPHRPERVRLAALTPFIGLTAAELDEQGEAGVETVAAQIRSLISAFHRGGVAGVLDVARSHGLAQRLLGRLGGERELTDIEHCAQVLQEQVLGGTTGLASLVAWMMKQAADDAIAPADSRILRLDSDALAVTLSTIHSSKGLQYPIVYAPFLFNNWLSDKEHAVIVHRDGRRVLSFDPADLGGAERRDDDLGEHMRLSYVAMTRAQSQLVLWWAPSYDSRNAGLHRLLFGQTDSPEALDTLLQERTDRPHLAPAIAIPDPLPKPSPASINRTLQVWTDHDTFSLAEIGSGDAPAKAEVVRATSRLAARSFDPSVIDRAWRRTSYSGLSAAHELAAADHSEPEDDVLGRTDEEAVTITAPAQTGDPALAAPSPMADQPVGATFGSLVHGVLEHVDLQASDLHAHLAEQVREQLVQWPVEVSVELLADALHAVCTTPLGVDDGAPRLADILGTDRFAEMDFELPLAGGDRPHGRPVLGDMADVLDARLAADDPLRPFATALRDESYGAQTLLGYLTGSVDLTFRHDGRYYVVDYKTNWLGLPGEPLTLADYTPSRLAAAMNGSSYPLQAILYSVVLHRYLRWRLPGYDPAEHFGGVMYLYLRGMAGPDTPVVEGGRCGIFSWQPPAGLLDELSDLLDGGGR